MYEIICRQDGRTLCIEIRTFIADGGLEANVEVGGPIDIHRV